MNAAILVVDDEADIRELLSRHFRYLGYEVETASHGKEALERLAATKIDILISDIMMPEMNGVELLKHVRAHYPMIRPIMITGYVTMENALACIRYGADSCVFKPLNDLSQLENAVNEATRRLRYWMDILRELRGMK
jgi:CheY-like chemotaxis protein